ncbi:autotransporter outer membrane beta-barrel domain-containing protein [Sphingomonas astaxanthinifaciens]|uniref:Exported lipase n=1 Tax=Sphingomonas astaxanthinifaciens DSM 22298 TaxID=1123267 RepID=A0ABQ5Z7J0_9SPHN|nr:autotransporter domain-containing protein [Sphingomonas astaxanthinifaciens]GLR46552.1 exported lipase [Sphingomonas astaxanthinifaciens DSM 22298]
MIQRLGARALLGATALVAVAAATPASAQRIDRIVTFGDSYADDGNLFELTGLNPATFQSGIYKTGRFSGGTNYVDTLSFLLGAPVENFAIGGATAVRGAPATTFDLQLQVDNFLNVGTQLPAFPNGAPTFGKGDLVTVSIGGNDARYFQQGFYGSLTVNDAISAARTQLDRLVAAGAPTISFLAGNTALLPEVAANPAAQAVRNTFSTTYNSALQSMLAGYANNGVIVHYLDLTKVLQSIQANPAAYGVPNGVTCAPTTANIGSGCAGYLFYVDNLHLSSDGFKIVGQYVQRQLQAPLNIGATSDLGLDTARQFGRTLNSRMDVGSPRDGEVLEGVRLFAVGDSFSRDVGMSDVTDQFDIDSVGGTVGAEAGFGGNGLVGIAGSYSKGRAKFGVDSARVEAKTWQAGVYAAYSLGPVFIQGHAGGGRTDYDIRRSGVVGNLDASPNGSHIVAGAKAGFLAPLGPVRVGPVVALDYARAKVDGYTENGDGALSLNVGKQRYEALVGGAGLELRGDFNAAGTALRPFASAMVEKDLKGDSRTLDFAQTASPTIVNHFDAGKRDQGIYTRFTGGASARITNAVQLDVVASTTAGKDQGNEVSGQVGVRIGF